MFYVGRAMVYVWGEMLYVESGNLNLPWGWNNVPCGLGNVYLWTGEKLPVASEMRANSGSNSSSPISYPIQSKNKWNFF